MGLSDTRRQHRVLLLRDLLTAIQTVMALTWLVLLSITLLYLYGLWDGRANDEATAEAGRTIRVGIDLLGPDRNGNESLRWHACRLGSGRAVWLENNELLFWVKERQVYAVNANARDITTGMLNPPEDVTEDAVRNAFRSPPFFYFFFGFLELELPTHFAKMAGGYALLTALAYIGIARAKRKHLPGAGTANNNTGLGTTS